jgi:hypothetical protein
MTFSLLCHFRRFLYFSLDSQFWVDSYVMVSSGSYWLSDQSDPV